MYWFLDFEQERVKFEVPADAFTERKGKEEEGKIDLRLRLRSGHVDHPTL